MRTYAAARAEGAATTRRIDEILLGEVLVRPTERVVVREGLARRLPHQPMTLLLHLMAHAGEVLSRESLFEAIWAEAEVEEGGLARLVSELRCALGDDARRPRYIETIPKTGYRLIAEVRPALAAPPRRDQAVSPRRPWGLAMAALAGFTVAFVVGAVRRSAG